MYSNLAFCDIYPLSKQLKEQLYRSLTPVSTAATMAYSLDTSDSNHTYEPIETAQAMSSQNPNTSHAAPLTLIHHDGKRVTTNKIVSLDNLRETLQLHEKVPYDDPESRGDLYILAPMRLLTPVFEESEPDLTRSKLYQSLASMSNTSQVYSDMDTSIMSAISEMLNMRGDAVKQQRGSFASDPKESRLTTIEEDSVDTCSLLHTIEEIRNNSLCNLYYSSSTDLSQVPNHPNLPKVPSRNTLGYESLIKENQECKNNPRVQEALLSNRLALPAATVPYNELPGDSITGNIESERPDLNDTIKSVHSNTLVVTPPTVKQAKKQKKSPLNTKIGVRKNILNLVGSTNDILNTPKRIKVGNLSLVKDTSVLSESMVSEQNEFKALVPHLTSQGAKFLSKVKANSGTDSDLETSRAMTPKQGQGDFSTFSSDTPSPGVFVRNIVNTKQPRRKFSIVRDKFEAESDNSDYKYGFMPEHPDAKYGFGQFTNTSTGMPTCYNVVETAKLCGDRTQSVPSLPSGYSLSALNRGDTDFKLRADMQYPADMQQRTGVAFNRNWTSTSLQRRPSKAGLGERTDTARRSMSILDDYEEKENIGPPRRPVKGAGQPPPPPLKSRTNKTSPMKILGNSVHSPQSRVYRLNPHRSTLSPKSKVFSKR